MTHMSGSPGQRTGETESGEEVIHLVRPPDRPATIRKCAWSIL